MKIDPANLDWRKAHGLLAGAVVPRPIALVSTISRHNVFNVAPFSFFGVVAVKPMLIGFDANWKGDGRKKTTLVNIECVRDFVVNVVNESLAEAMIQAARSRPSCVDKFGETGLTPVKADIVRSPMVGESPINMECRLVQVLEFGNRPIRSSFIIGEVVRVHIKDWLYVNNEIDMFQLNAIARMGGRLYCRTRDIFGIKESDSLSYGSQVSTPE